MQDQSHTSSTPMGLNTNSVIFRLDPKNRHRNLSMKQTLPTSFLESIENSGMVGRLPLPLVPPANPTSREPKMNLQEFRLKWALKKMMRKLHGLSVPYVNYSGEKVEEWEKRVGEDELEDEK